VSSPRADAIPFSVVLQDARVVEIDPDWDPLREHPRYREILQEFGR
jgi:hypothetical protein